MKRDLGVAELVYRAALRGIVQLAGILIVVSFLWGTRAQGQATSGVTGVVTDQSGALVPGATVTLTNDKTGYNKQTTTDDQGVYQFIQVPPGDGYKLSFVKQNFRTLEIAGVYLGVSVTETRNAQLVVGATTQQIEVMISGEGTINTTDASIGSVIETKTITDLPIQIRISASALLGLEPGVQYQPGTGVNDQQGSVTGSRADQQTLTIDGLDVTDETIGQAFTTVGRAPVDSVQELRTVVGNGDTSYGRSSGGQVDLVTKSGTNNFHGGLHEYNRNTDFEANSFFSNLTGVPRPTYIRNQFGGDIGGPILKDKLFFFFDYDAQRLNTPQQVIRSVPVDAFRAGEMNYINDGPGCDGSARLNTNPTCISTLPATSSTPGQQSVQSLDPASIGDNTQLLALIDSRYPEPNFPSGGDGINTEGYLFNAPQKFWENTFVGRVDYNVNSKNKLFGRATWDRDHGDDGVPQFPGDPEALTSEINHNRSWVVGWTWQPTPNVVNYLYGGQTRQVLFFPNDFAPTSPNLFEWGYNTTFDNPYGSFSSQGRNVNVPEVREQLSWEKGRHTMEFGGDFRPIREFSQLANSFNFLTLGLYTNIPNLDPTLRPTDIYTNPNDQTATREWDGMYTALLGHYAGTSSNYNYDIAGNPLAITSPSNRNYAYNEFELYAQDTWKIRSDLTFLYGLRWVFHGVPWEVNGYESVVDTTEQQLFSARLSAANQGINGFDAVPIVSYELAGAGNKGATLGYYRPDYKDFAPRIGLAYSPSFTDGVLGTLLGNRKTSIRAGTGIVYDRVLNTLEFELDQENFMFSNSPTQVFPPPQTTPEQALASDPRFTGLTTPPLATPSPISRPTYTPNVNSGGVPIGIYNGGFPNFFAFNQNLRTPYAVTASLGVQRELPGDFLVEADYFGRFGRRLVAIGDAAQQTDFTDPTSKQTLYQAFGAVETQLQNNTAITAQPWFENQMSAAIPNFYGAGANCVNVAALYSVTAANCTQLAAAPQIAGPVWSHGDVSSTDLDLTLFGFINPNTGLPAQTGSAGYIGNFSSSNYNSLLLTVRKRVSYNLSFTFNYAYAHSIDNMSEINNNFVLFTSSGQGLICDLRNLRICRANSDFDARHTFIAYYDYQLPFGRGQRFLGDASKLLDAVVGGWGTSGIVTWHSGYPVNTSTGTFPTNFTQDAPAVYVGPGSNIVHKVSVDAAAQSVQWFANPGNALNAFQFPFGGGTGTRNALPGPNFANTDMGIYKNFTMPWSDNQHLQFRADAFNVFNNVSWSPPATAIENVSTFGLITSQANNPRVLQVALRYEF